MQYWESAADISQCPYLHQTSTVIDQLWASTLCMYHLHSVLQLHQSADPRSIHPLVCTH